jgi:PKD repeat protein
MRLRIGVIGLCGLCIVASIGTGLADCPALAGRWPYAPVQTVSAAGTTAYLGSDSTLVVLDVSNPASPAVLGSLALPGSVKKIAVSGAFAYVAAGGAGLLIINVSDPTHPTEVGHLDGPAYDVALSGNRVFLAAGDLRIYDGSNPEALILLGTWTTGDYSFQIVATSGDFAYVVPGPASDSVAPLAVVRVSDPAHPVQVGTFIFGGLDQPVPTDIAVAGNLALVAETAIGGLGGMAILDISNPPAAGWLGSYQEVGGQGLAVAASGGFAFLAEGNRGLRIIDIADPHNPVPIASVPTADTAIDAAVSGHRVYVADRQGGLWLFDTSACGASGCSLSCTPQVPTTTAAGTTVVLRGSYLQTNCGGASVFAWDFGDGSQHSSEQSPSHTYLFGGNLRWSLTVTLGGASCTTSGTIHVASTLAPISSPGAFAYLVPTSAHKDGYNGTHWATDVAITNPGLADAVVRLYFMKGWQDNSGSAAHPVVVPLRRSLKLVDVVQTTFLETSASGAFLVAADVPLIVTSRTYNLTEGGSYGQYVEGYPLAQGAATGQTAWLTQLPQSATTDTGFRTNVGVVNVTGQPIVVDISLSAADGVWLGTKTVVLNPFDFQQVDRIFTQFAPLGVDNGYALLTTSTQRALFFAYASVIDNQTGDPIAVPARVPPTGP